MRAQERLYLTADKKKLVGEGDPKAAFLYAAEGDEIPDSAAAMFGLADGRLKAKKAAPPAPPAAPKAPAAKKGAAAKEQVPAENKEQVPAENKEQASAEDKGAGQ